MRLQDFWQPRRQVLLMISTATTVITDIITVIRTMGIPIVMGLSASTMVTRVTDTTDRIIRLTGTTIIRFRRIDRIMVDAVATVTRITAAVD